MCGIFALVCSKNNKKLRVQENFNKIKERGGDQIVLKAINDVTTFGFHRLAINGLNNGEQPLEYDNTTLICNGEIYNHVDLCKKYNFTVKTDSDCEVILHLYSHFKGDIIKVSTELDGVFAFVLLDNKTQTLLASRDPFGVRPLFWGTEDGGDTLAFASEAKALVNLVPNPKQFKPGHTWASKGPWSGLMLYYNVDTINHNLWSQENLASYFFTDQDTICKNINKLFKSAVYKRLMSNRPICGLLSGGLDSSLVAAIACKEFPDRTFKTFSIGLKDSPDLRYAQLVANHIKSDHTEIIITEKDMLDAIEETIYITESFDVTTIRASVGNLLIAKYIKKNSDCKVIYGGDFSDELTGGYLYFKNVPDSTQFHEECIRLIRDIHFFDCLRADRTISSQSLELRVPFADKFFVSYYLNIPVKYRYQPEHIEKYLLRKAFADEDLLPFEVLWRKKEAFSDGVSKYERSWFQIIQEHVNLLITDEEFEARTDNNINNQTKEAYWYRKIFDKHYSQCTDLIPYYWMPRWTSQCKDPSARMLESI